MSDEELGRLSYAELGRSTLKARETSLEREERLQALLHGKPGISPLLSRRVVRQMRELLSRSNLPVAAPWLGIAICTDETRRGYEQAIHDVARWLLALDSDDPAPLEDG